jgi:hypothetical protein
MPGAKGHSAKIDNFFSFFSMIPTGGYQRKKNNQGYAKFDKKIPFFLMIPIGYQRKNATQGILENRNICCSGEFKVGSSRGM